MSSEAVPAPKKRNWLYLQVLAAIAIGILLGHFVPDTAKKLEPLGIGFTRLIKMLVGPLIFTGVVTGIAGTGDVKRIGRVGLKAILYFELLTTVALGIGLGVMHLVTPGVGMNVNPETLDSTKVEEYQKKAHSGADFVLGMIPESVTAAFASNDIIGVLVFAVLLGMALGKIGEKKVALLQALESLNAALFAIVSMIMKLAPLGALGAMAFTIGAYGLGSLANLGELMIAFYATVILFAVLVLAPIAFFVGVNPVRLFWYFREELLLVLGTSSSESALPHMLTKLEALGCEKSVVNLVVPTGYSFNLDGTCIYLTMAALFLAQATNTQLTFGEELAILGVLLLSSKGAAAVTGGGFVTLAATLGSTKIPVASLALLFGIDRFMSEARALTNLVGNAVATLVVSKWEGQLDLEQARRVLRAASEKPG